MDLNLNFGMDKKYFALFATIAICFMVIETGFIFVSLDDNRYGDKNASWEFNKFEIYTVIRDFGAPAFAEDIHYYVLSFGSSFAKEQLFVSVISAGGSLEGIFAYFQKPGFYKHTDVNNTSNDIIWDDYSYGDPNTLVRYGVVNELETTVSEYATNTNPWVIVFVIRLSTITNPKDITISTVISPTGG